MKLVYCLKCGDMFRLQREPRSCKCGECSGEYVNNTDATVKGNGVGIGIGNGSLFRAISKVRSSPDGADRDYFLERCNIIAWARPMSGPGNPHTEESK